MKITYINNGFISEGFIKTVDKMKGSLDKKLTADDIRKETKKLLIGSILNNREFLSKCEPCFTHYIHYKAGASSPALDFKYVDLRDGVLRIICDVHYPNINIYERDNIFWIDDTKIMRYSAEELNSKIDAFCTKCMLQNFKKNQPEVLEYVERIHIERINFWLGHKDIDGEFPKKIFLKITSEFDQKKTLNEIEFNELLNKVNALFSFCAKNVFIEKIVPVFEEHKDTLASDVAALLDGDNAINSLLIKTNLPPRWSDLQVSDKYDKVSLAGLTRKDLHEYTIDVVVKVIDLHKYLTNNDIEESTIKESSAFWAIPDVNIITTADYSEIEQIKCQLTEFIANIYNDISYRETKGKYLPDPKSGSIEYLLAAYDTTWTSDINPYVVNMDFIDGEYHKAYYTPLRKY